MPARKKNTPQSMDFEQSMAELETIVEEMETGELTLQQSMRRFERGMELTKQCQKLLAAAEQKVQILGSDGERLAEFVDGEGGGGKDAGAADTDGNGLPF